MEEGCVALSRLSQVLKTIASFDNVEHHEIIPEQQEQSNDTKKQPLGTWSDIKFHRLTNVTFAIRRLNPPAFLAQPAEIVISHLKPATEHVQIFEEKDRTAQFLKNYEYNIQLRKLTMLNSFTLLRSNNIPLRFNLHYLAFGSDGSKISFRGKEDLFEFFVTHYEANIEYFSFENFKRMIGQLILSVFELHINNRAHRDIKHENWIVNNYDGKIFLLLGDHGDMVETQENGTSKETLMTIAGTKELIAPELAACTEVSDYQTYQTLDLKAIDCYALGVVIEQLADKIFPDYTAVDEENIGLAAIIKVAKGLKYVTPSERLTIIDTMNSEFFGENMGARTNFFANLVEEKDNYELLIDGRYKICTENYLPDDYFLLLDRRLKPIFTKSEQLAEEIDECHKQIAATKDLTTTSFSTTIANIHTRKKELVANLSCLTANSIFSKVHSKLDEVERIFDYELLSLDFEHLLKIAKDTLDKFIHTQKTAHPHKLFTQQIADEVYQFQQLLTKARALVLTEQDPATLLTELINFIGTTEVLEASSLKHTLNTRLADSLGPSYEHAKQLAIAKITSEEHKEATACVA
jgi:serine/threonine protein kinase